MKIKKCVLAAVFTAAIGWTGVASAEAPRLTAIREGVSAIDARTKGVRARAERANPQLRQESERIVRAVAEQRATLVTRLEVLQLLGRTGDVDDTTVNEMEQRYAEADRLLALVESWYRPR